MPSSNLSVLVLFVVYWLVAIAGVVLAFSVVWAIWRMTWAHERIERHVAEIARLMASRTSGGSA